MPTLSPMPEHAGDHGGGLPLDESFEEYLRELFSELGPISLRRMFGGRGLYHDGSIIGLVMGEELFLKTDAFSIAAFESAGGQPFVYRGKGKAVRTSYWLPPAEAMESAQAMQPWACQAYAAATRKNAATGRPRTAIKRNKPRRD